MSLEAKQPVGEWFEPLGDRVSIGSDPEVFVFSGDKMFPAFEFLPHKDTPLETHGPHYNTSAGTGYRSEAYWDGFQAEFRLCHPHMCLMYLTQYMQIGLKSIINAAREKKSDAKLSLQSVVRIPSQTLRTAFDPFVTLGCEPSFNAYNLNGLAVENPRLLRYRFAGGHMHFGALFVKNDVVKRVKALDKILGVWSIGAAQSFDNPIRRKYYGMAGEYRTPSHGLEYRVLSNFWLSSPIILHAVWEIGRRALFLSQTEYDNLWVAPEEMVIEAIQNGDVKIARKLMELNKPIFKWLFGSRGWTSNAIERLFDVGLNGIESVIDDPTDIEKNWLISRNDYQGLAYSPASESHKEYTWNGYADQVFPAKG